MGLLQDITLVIFSSKLMLVTIGGLTMPRPIKKWRELLNCPFVTLDQFLITGAIIRFTMYRHGLINRRSMLSYNWKMLSSKTTVHIVMVGKHDTDINVYRIHSPFNAFSCMCKTNIHIQELVSSKLLAQIYLSFSSPFFPFNKFSRLSCLHFFSSQFQWSLLAFLLQKCQQINLLTSKTAYWWQRATIKQQFKVSKFCYIVNKQNIDIIAQITILINY